VSREIQPHDVVGVTLSRDRISRKLTNSYNEVRYPRSHFPILWFISGSWQCKRISDILNISALAHIWFFGKHIAFWHG